MFKISKKMDYALIALKYISERERLGLLTTAREICDNFHTPFDTTSKVMQTMNNANILSSVQGVKGGYQLEKNMQDISLIYLSELIDNKTTHNSCEGDDGTCDLIENCNIVSQVQNLRTNIYNYFNNISLADLLEVNESKTINTSIK